MSSHPDLAQLDVEEFARRLRPDLIPLNSQFAYLSVGIALTEEDLKEYLEDPIAALPPKLSATLPKAAILFVPYLETERGGHGAKGRYRVCFERPNPKRMAWSASQALEEGVVLVMAINDHDVADYHYHFYGAIARLAADACSAENWDRYAALVRQELSASAHGEVDEDSWHLKQQLMRRQKGVRRGKAFGEYARQSFTDTLTLYLHGICCDIDVETGPRQLASRRLRQRLELLQDIYPPPEGFSIFPDEPNGA